VTLRHALLTAAAFVLVVSAWAKDGLDIRRSFENGGQKLQVATYTKGNETVGLLSIGGAKRVSFCSRRQMWHDFIALWEQSAQVPPVRWRFVGALNESDTTNPSHLVLYAGPAAQLVLVDPSEGALVFTLLEGDRAAFVDALRRVEGELSP
jgi:hypothetical protein